MVMNKSENKNRFATNDGIERLATAIISQVVKEYRSALKVKAQVDIFEAAGLPKPEQIRIEEGV